MALCAVSQFRACILQRTRLLQSLKVSPSETLLTTSAVVKCDGLWSISWMDHQMFYSYTTISAAQARESEDLHHAMSPFSLFSFFFFSGTQRILDYVRPRKIVAVHPPKPGKRRSLCGLHLEEPSHWDCLRTAWRHNWPSNAPLKDADSGALY